MADNPFQSYFIPQEHPETENEKLLRLFIYSYSAELGRAADATDKRDQRLQYEFGIKALNEVLKVMDGLQSQGRKLF